MALRQGDRSALDALALYRLTDGSYRHVRAGAADMTATEQALRALLAVENGALYA